MVLYQFYLWDDVSGHELVGVLPERRKTPERITDQSILNWGKANFCKNVQTQAVLFIKVLEIPGTCRDSVSAALRDHQKNALGWLHCHRP